DVDPAVRIHCPPKRIRKSFSDSCLVATEPSLPSHITRSNHGDHGDSVQQRDASFDGQFVFAVKTTGVYCRPSCAARQPLRKNVSFFATPDAAESAGYRACRRCRPRADRSDAATNVAVKRARAYLDQNGDRAVPMAELTRHAGL